MQESNLWNLRILFDWLIHLHLVKQNYGLYTDH